MHKAKAKQSSNNNNKDLNNDIQTGRIMKHRRSDIDVLKTTENECQLNDEEIPAG